MNLDNEFIFFFSALGAFNSIILSVYFLFFARSDDRSNYFLGGLLAALSIRVWKSLFFYFNPDLSKIYLQIGLSACFLIGPFLYFFVKAKTKSSTGSKIQSYIHFSTLLSIVLIVGLLYPYQTYVDLWISYFYQFINIQWLAYILIAAFLMKGAFRKLFSSKEKIGYNEIWLLSIFLGVLVIWVAYNTSSYTSYLTGALSFSFVFYLSALLIFLKRKKEFVVSVKKEKYANVQIADNEANQLLEKILHTLKEEKLYKNPNLTMPALAKAVNIRPQLLSQLLNHNLDKSFSQFINEYRIEEAKVLLKDEPNVKIEVIAEKCGYNSKSTFYGAFKKITNTTPAKFLE